MVGTFNASTSSVCAATRPGDFARRLGVMAFDADAGGGGPRPGVPRTAFHRGRVGVEDCGGGGFEAVAASSACCASLYTITVVTHTERHRGKQSSQRTSTTRNRSLATISTAIFSADFKISFSRYSRSRCAAFSRLWKSLQ